MFFFFPSLSMESCSISCSFLRIFDGPTLWIFRQAGGETIFPKHQRCQVGGTVFWMFLVTTGFMVIVHSKSCG